jgi:dTDP-4-dehydrorhamnose reductase
MRIAVTGATGRLGSALVAALADAPFPGPGGPLAWGRRDLDLDAPEAAAAALDRDRPEVVVHTAAWTDVDGCARDPERALARNGTATETLAKACAHRGIDLVVVSTNEVFDGQRTDGLGYGPGDEPSPGNPYGASKLAGERAAAAAYDAIPAGGRLGIVRTAWLFGPGEPDFPRKILAAAERAVAAGEPLRAVADEWGTPTYTHDVADAIVELLAEDAHAGVHHVVNGLTATRALWAEDVLARFGVAVPVEHVPGASWERASVPPPWGVLAATPLPSGEPLRPWHAAMADYAPALERARRQAAAADRAR